jgi:hypothetical protein
LLACGKGVALAGMVVLACVLGWGKGYPVGHL